MPWVAAWKTEWDFFRPNCKAVTIVRWVCMRHLITSNGRIGWREKENVRVRVQTQTKGHDNNYTKTNKTRVNCVRVFFLSRYGLCISIRCWFRSKCVLLRRLFSRHNLNEWMNEEKIWLIVMFGYPDSSSLAFNETLFARDNTETVRQKSITFKLRMTSTFHASGAKN